MPAGAGARRLLDLKLQHFSRPHENLRVFNFALATPLSTVCLLQKHRVMMFERQRLQSYPRAVDSPEFCFVIFGART